MTVASKITTRKKRAAATSRSAIPPTAKKDRSARPKHASRQNAPKEGTAPPPAGVRSLREELGLSQKVFARFCNCSERAVAAWEAGKPLGATIRQRMIEVRRLQEALAGIMKATYIGEWLQTPNPVFDGLKPLEVIERGQTDRIWRMVHVLESGEPA
jgi:DNA-binding transcriptional regulator YiaG